MSVVTGRCSLGDARGSVRRAGLIGGVGGPSSEQEVGAR